VKNLTVLIDSWSWIEYFQGKPRGKRALEAIEGEERAVVSAINLAEVYRWALSNRSKPEADLTHRILTRRCEIVPVSSSIAVRAAVLRHERKWGLGDALIFATAEASDARLVTGDPDFRNVPGVDFIG
jgi:predicted nucleic acid-binding protein